jgi:hypothetical protein
MSAPAYFDRGSATNSTGAAVSVVWPTGLSTTFNDVGFLIVETSGNSADIAAPTGWTTLTGSPITDVATTAGSKLHVFWKRVTTTSEPAVTVGPGTDHVSGRIFVWRNLHPTEDFFDGIAASVKSTPSTTATSPAVTTTVPDTSIFFITARPNDDGNSTQFGNPVNANLTSISEIVDFNFIEGNGGGYQIARAICLSPKDIGVTIRSKSASTTDTCYTIALKNSPMVIELAAYCFYEDGAETTSTAIDAQNTQIARLLDSDSSLQVRVRIQETAGVFGNVVDDYRLQYSLNGGTYTDVTTGSSAVLGFASASLANDTVTTNRLGSGSGSFVAGEISETGLVTSKQLTASNYMELLYSITVVAAEVDHNDTIDFRVLRNGVVIPNAVTPRIVTTKTGGSSDTTTTQDQTGKARVEAVASQDQTGKSRLETVSSRDQLGTSAIEVAETVTPRTQTGVSRVQIQAVRTQTGIARVQEVVSRLQLGTARILTTRSEDQTGKARVTASVQQSQIGVARLTATATKNQTGVASVDIPTGTTSRAQTGAARILAPLYTKESLASLPTGKTSLAASYSGVQMTDAAADNDSFVDLTQDKLYGVHLFSVPHSTNTSPLTPTWKGRTSRPTTSSPIYMQIYNVAGGSWETIDTDNSTASNVEITLTASIATDVANYYDSDNAVHVRVYQ